METLRLGVIGAGNVVQGIHLEVLRRRRDASVVAVADSDPVRREEARRRVPGATVLGSYGDLLAIPDVQAVIVCLPSTLQAEAAIAAFESGKHVYVEKPLAANTEDGRAVVSAWRRAGTVGMVGLNYRLHPHYRRAKDIIRSGKLGELVGARSIFSAPIALPQPDWKRSRQAGGGALLDFGSHHVDLVHFLFGQSVREVFADTRSQQGDDDSATLQLRLSGGVLVQSFFSLSAVDEERFDVYGQAAKLVVDRCCALNVETREATRDRVQLDRIARTVRAVRNAGFLLTRSRAVGYEPSYALALGRFIEAARAGGSPDPDLWDGYRSLAVVEAAQASTRQGTPTSVPEISESDLVDRHLPRPSHVGPSPQTGWVT